MLPNCYPGVLYWTSHVGAFLGLTRDAGQKSGKHRRPRPPALPVGAYPRVPNFFPTFWKTSSAWSSSGLVWVAVTMVRTRALPFGTVGKPMPVASTPSAKSSRESSCATLASPTITGVMGVSLIPVLNPADIKPCLKYLVLLHRFFIRSGSCSSTSKAARQAAATAGGCEVEKRNGRARWYRNSIRSRLPHTYPPSTPIALESVPT